MNKEIEWFCYRAVGEGLIEAAQCRAVAEALRNANIGADLTAFAQAVVDNDLCDDVERLEELMNMAVEEARSLGFPPQSILEPDDAPPPPETPADEPAPEPLPAPRNPTAALPPQTTRTAGEPIPSLAGAEALSDKEAREFMVNYLAAMREVGASDLHLSAMARPFYRRNLVNEFIEESVLSPEAAEKLNLALLTQEQRQFFEKNQDLDYSLAFSDTNRFRVNVMVHKNGIQGSYRLIPDRIRNLDELGFKKTNVIRELLNHHNGLILVTGPAGSGKTTTLAAMVALLNGKRHDNIITVEDPIEIVQVSQKCNVNQREIGAHTKSFHSALKAALREDPDIIVIGEMRDLETIEMAITAAETGHLVIGTLHTSDAATTLNRILDVFPPAAQAQIRAMTSESLKGIICQKLLPTINGGLTVAAEVLIANTAVGNIIREGKMHQLKAVLQTGASKGMSTMDNSVLTLYKEGTISADVAIGAAVEADTIRQIKSGADQATASEAEAKQAPAPAKKKGWFR